MIGRTDIHTPWRSEVFCALVRLEYLSEVLADPRLRDRRMAKVDFFKFCDGGPSLQRLEVRPAEGPDLIVV